MEHTKLTELLNKVATVSYTHLSGKTIVAMTAMYAAVLAG